MIRPFLYAAGLLIIVSCSKNQNNPVISKSKAVENFEKIGEQSNQRMTFSLMTSQEQEAIVSQHISFCIQYFHLNNTQVQILNEAKTNLHEIFTSQNPETSQVMIKLEKDIQKYFSTLNPYVQGLLFDSMVNSEEDIANMPVADPNTPVNCTCSTQSNWCSGWGQGSLVNCNTSACNIEHKRGCGTFWGWSCKGKCTIGN
ncbi:bacteriocin fulvocin C-related protein [Fluviicola taffensis]|uniref:bacteriocin fulvocin C-related protein n=1 Tax=Fluviicola taffensis TaxID=191579 RepID=UPI0031377725